MNIFILGSEMVINVILLGVPKMSFEILVCSPIKSTYPSILNQNNIAIPNAS